MDAQLDALQKLPPQSVEMEQSVLGAILQDSHALVRVLEILQDRDFYQDAHRWIFQTMIDLFQDNVPIDALTVTERLRKKGRLEAWVGRPISPSWPRWYRPQRMSCTTPRWCGKRLYCGPSFRLPPRLSRKAMRTPKTLIRCSIELSRRSLRLASAKRRLVLSISMPS